MDTNLIVETDLTEDQNVTAIKTLLSTTDTPTAVVVFNDYVARDAIRYSKEAGYEINKNIYFTSYANLPMTTYMDHPPIVSVEQFPHEQAEKATDILLKLVESKNAPQEIKNKIVLEGKLVVRQKMTYSGGPATSLSEWPEHLRKLAHELLKS